MSGSDSETDPTEQRVHSILGMFEPNGALQDEYESYRTGATSLSAGDPNQLRTHLFCKIADVVAKAAAEDEELFVELGNIVSEAHCSIEEVRKRMMRDFDRHVQFWKGETAGEAFDAAALSNSLLEHIQEIGQITSSPQRNKKAAVFAVAVLFDLLKRVLELASELDPPSPVYGNTIDAAVREIEAFPEDVLQSHEDGVKELMQALEETETASSQLQANLARRLGKKAAFFTGARKRRERGSGSGGNAGEGSSKRRG